MTRICLTCGHNGELEAHHVAGRRNHPFTVDVCVDCHRLLSDKQRAAGIELRAAVEGVPLDSSRALLVGAMHLVQLFAERHAGMAWFPDWLAVRTARAISKLLDMCQPADRPGRWLPDPTVVPAVAAPMQWPASHEVDWIAEMARLAQALTGIIGGIPPLAVATVAAIVRDPAGWKAEFDHALQDQQFATALVGLGSQYIDISNVLMATLFQLEDDFNDDLVCAVAAWKDTIRALFNQLRMVAPDQLKAAS
jgi:hypothetical protein